MREMIFFELQEFKATNSKIWTIDTVTRANRTQGIYIFFNVDLFTFSTFQHSSFEL